MFRASIQLLPHQKNLVPISKPIVSQAGSWRQDPGCVEGGGSWLRCAQTAPTATQQHQGSWSSHSWDLWPWWTLSFRWFACPVIWYWLWRPTVFLRVFKVREERLSFHENECKSICSSEKRWLLHLKFFFPFRDRMDQPVSELNMWKFVLQTAWLVALELKSGSYQNQPVFCYVAYTSDMAIFWVWICR